jgi:hypothetical protein
MRRARLAEQVAVVAQRRRLRADLDLEVREPRRRDLAKRRAPLASLTLTALDLALERIMLGDQRRHPRRRPLLVEEAFRHPPAARAPATGGIVVEPSRPQATLHLTAAAPPLRFEHRTVAALHDDQRASRVKLPRIVHQFGEYHASTTLSRVPL